MKKNFSIDDVEIIQDKDALSGDMLSKIVGGANADQQGCLCKCDKGNCYADGGTVNPGTPEEPSNPILL